jgi:hypothetical protein
MNIDIQVIPHNEQRYPTVGDWLFTNEDLHIKISALSNPKFEFLVAFHELIEVILCKEHNIKEEDVTNFDLMFEEERDNGLHDEEAEPGNDPRAPYHEEHQIATNLEYQMALMLGVNWEEYEKAIYSL